MKKLVSVLVILAMFCASTVVVGAETKDERMKEKTISRAIQNHKMQQKSSEFRTIVPKAGQSGYWGSFGYSPDIPMVGQRVVFCVIGDGEELDYWYDGTYVKIPYTYTINGVTRYFEELSVDETGYLYSFGYDYPLNVSNTITVRYISCFWSDYYDDLIDIEYDVYDTFTYRAIKQMSVKYDANKGKIGKKRYTVQTEQTDASYGALPKAKRKNYMFKGWYTKKKGGQKITATTQVTNPYNHTLYAQWIGPKGKGKTTTKKEYKRIKKGMTYAQAKFLIGGKGKLISSKKKGKYKVYRWRTSGMKSEFIALSFKNNKVIFKNVQ